MTSIMIGLVGDLFLNREDPQLPFRHVREILQTPDILFGNLEGAYTDNPHPAPGNVIPIGGPSRNLDIFFAMGFNVVSLANNHILDLGCAAMLENKARLAAQNVATCGVGASMEDARQPAIVDAQGLRVAFLGYASIFPFGFEAGLNSPGLVPVRAYDLWRTPMPNIHMPGARPIAVTMPDHADMARLAEDIQRARQSADLVIASFHWGDQSRPFHLTDHEIRTARYCIDQGADMVVGHHHHAIRGMDWYNGRPILYGLGHFVFDFRLTLTPQELRKQLLELSPEANWDAPYVLTPHEGWPLLPMHADTRMTLFAWARANRNGVFDVGFLPCKLRPDGAVQPLSLDSDESAEVLRYFDKGVASQRLNARVVVDNAPSIAGYQTLRVVPAKS